MTKSAELKCDLLGTAKSLSQKRSKRPPRTSDVLTRSGSFDSIPHGKPAYQALCQCHREPERKTAPLSVQSRSFPER
jgi:hypothetical protein